MQVETIHWEKQIKVAVVERWLLYRAGHCREVATVKKWFLVERLL